MGKIGFGDIHPVINLGCIFEKRLFFLIGKYIWEANAHYLGMSSKKENCRFKDKVLIMGGEESNQTLIQNFSAIKTENLREGGYGLNHQFLISK